MDENLGLALLRDLQQQSSQFHNTDEFMQYMKDADIALETVKNILLEDGPPEKVLQRCFHMLIVFYDADWCGALNADLDLDIFTPVWWDVFCKYFLAKIPDKIPEFSFSKMAKIPDACISAFWSSMIPFQTFYLMGFIYEYCRILRQYFFSVSTRQVWCQGLWSIYPSRPKWDVSIKRPDPLTP